MGWYANQSARHNAAVAIHKEAKEAQARARLLGPKCVVKHYASLGLYAKDAPKMIADGWTIASQVRDGGAMAKKSTVTWVKQP